MKLARGFGANMDAETRREFYGELGRALGEGDLNELPHDIHSMANSRTETGLVMVDEVQQTLAQIAPWVSAPNGALGLVGSRRRSTLLEAAISTRCPAFPPRFYAAPEPRERWGARGKVGCLGPGDARTTCTCE